MNNTFKSKNTYMINVTCNGITGKTHICNKFDYEVIDEMYKKYDEFDNPLVYNFLYKLALNIPKNKTLVTFSPDPSITGATIAGLSEKHMYVECEKYMSSLKIIYITSSPHLLSNYKDTTIENLRNSTISTLLGWTDKSYIGNKLILNPKQFILIGINDNLIEEDEKEELDNSEISYFTMSQIRKKGITNIVDYINEQIGSDPLMIVFDMSATSYDTSPCVTRFLKDGAKTEIKKLNGFTFPELTQIFGRINVDNLVGLDITSYDFRIDDKEIEYRISCETARLPMKLLLGIKDKKINIFNEHSRFLIYRPIEQTSESDLGWYILRNIPLETREEILKTIDKDTITSIAIDVEENGEEEMILISTTTMMEQESKCFLAGKIKMTDCVLFPQEKTSMMFELLNTSENSLHV